MYEALIKSVEELFPGKQVLTIDDVCVLLDCEPSIIHNWIKRNDPHRRPPKLIVGNAPRFPKKPFVEWLTKEQARGASK